MASSSYNETPDSLQSNATIRVLDVLSEGPILGLAADAQSIFFDGTPLVNPDSTTNFSDATAAVRLGTPSQDYMPGFPDVEDDTSINTQITFAGPVTHFISTSTVDAARITLEFPSGLSLQYADSSGSGIKGTSVVISIETAGDAGIYTEVMRKTITGKTSSAYQVSYRVEKPAGATLWSVRVKRITADSTSSLQIDQVFFELCTEIQDVKEQYNNTAYIGTTVSAKATGNAVPARTFDVLGLQVPIPVNYDPNARTYSGDWDGGSFTVAWTNNPAWIILEMIRNTRWGVGDLSDDIIDFMSFYNAAQYNDQLVDDGSGLGTMEPRYTFNYQITARDNDWTLIQTMAANSNCVICNNPLVVMLQDRPAEVATIVTNANVIGGLFTYAGSAGGTRYTQANVTFSDKTNHYLPKTITYQDNNAIDIYGDNSTDVSAYGVTSEGQARRQAKYIVDTSINTTDTVTFSTGLHQMYLDLFDIIDVMDNDYTGASFGGVITGGTSTSIALDRAVTFLPGKTYTLTVLADDGSTLLSNTISTGAGTFSTITLFSALASGNTGNALKGRVFAIQCPTDVSARPFRVTSIAESKAGQFDITAVQYDAGKYARIEGGIAVTTPTYSQFGGSTIATPANVKFAVEQFVNSVGGNSIELFVSWDQVIDSTLKDYIFQWRVNDGPYSAPITCSVNSYAITNIVPGNYDVLIRTETIKGLRSTPTTASFDYVPTGSNNLNPPTGLQLAPGTGSGLNFNTQDLSFIWSAPVTNKVGLAGYTIKIFNNAANALIDTVLVDSKTLAYTFPFLLNAHFSGGPFRQLRVEVYSTDVQGLISITSANTVFTNPAPAVPNVTIIPSNKMIGVSIDLPSDPDFVGLAVWMSQVQGYIPDGSTLVAFTPGLSVTISANNGTYFLHVGAFDSFGNVALNLSGELRVDVTDFSLFEEPDSPSGLKLVSQLVEANDGSQSANLTATWTAVTTNVTSYTLRIRDISNPNTLGGLVTVTTTDTTYSWTGLLNAETYGVSIRADNVYVSSAYGTEVTLQTSGDTVGPAAPTALVLTPAFQDIFLDWNNPPDLDLNYIEVWASTTDNRANANVVGTATAPQSFFDHAALFTGATWFYWIRAVDNSLNTSPFFPFSPLNGISTKTLTLQTADYANLSIGNAAIGNLAVDNTKIANATITAAKIALATITAAQIGNATISGANIAQATITAANIALGIITTALIGDGQITTAKIGTGQITNAVIQDATILTAKIAQGQITNALIANAAITAAKIVAATITNVQIAKGTITFAEIATATIQQANIANAAIGNAQIQNAAVGTLTIAGNAVTVPTSAFTAAATTVATNTTQIVQSVTFTASGGPVFISYAQVTTLQGAGTTGTGTVTFTMQRNGNTIYSAPPGRTGGASYLDCFHINDVPPAGPVTYTVFVAYVQTSSTLGLISNCFCGAKSLFSIETKR